MAKMNVGLTGSQAGAGAGLQTTVPSATGSRSFARTGQGGMPKVVTVVLCEDELYKSDGSNTVWVSDIYDLPQVRALGPMIKQIRAFYVCEGATANFQARLTTQWSVLGKSWSTPVGEILPGQTGDKAGIVSAAFTDADKFGLLMRYGIEVKNSSGTAIESGRVTVILEIELKS